MQLRNTSAIALRGVHHSSSSVITSSSSCARRSIFSSPSSSVACFSTSASRSIAKPTANRLRTSFVASSAASSQVNNASVGLFSGPSHIRTMASQASKIKVKNPVVELDGDEVSRFLFSTLFLLFKTSSAVANNTNPNHASVSFFICRERGPGRGEAAHGFRPPSTTLTNQFLFRTHLRPWMHSIMCFRVDRRTNLD